MAIRERLRKTFSYKKKDGSSSGGSTPSTSSDPSHYTGRTDIEYYKPHEIPKSKYKGKVDPEHKERLESYSFAAAFTTIRRKSSQALSGIMSPGGTKSQSRRASYMSYMSKASRDGRRKSIAGNSVSNEPPISRSGTLAGPPATLIRENSDDDTNVLNAGLSRQGTANLGHQTILSVVPPVRLERQPIALDQHDQPFTLEELEMAMTRATIRAEDHSSLQNSMAVAAH